MNKTVKTALQNLWRNKFLTFASIIVMAIILFIFNILLTVNFIAISALEQINNQIDIPVYLSNEASAEEIQTLLNDIEQLDIVSNIEYTSKEEALQIINQSLGKLTNEEKETLEKFTRENNPLPASIHIYTFKPQDHELVYRFLEQEKYQLIIDQYDKKESNIIKSISKNLIGITEFSFQLMVWIVFAFLIGGILVIVNAIQLTIFTRKKEIEIMKLVGAKFSHIRAPFIIEGIIYGFSASVISFLLWIIVSRYILETNTNLSFFTQGINPINVLIIEIAISVFLGILCSTFALNRYLKK